MMNNFTRSRQHLYPLVLQPITIAPVINLILLLFMFLTITPFVLSPSAAQIYLPKTIPSDTIPEQTLTITVTSEDIIYFQGAIVTEKELKQALRTPEYKKQPILIKADRRSSLSRIIDIWNVCRELGLERINLAATKK